MFTRKSLDHGDAAEALNASIAHASDMLAKTLENARTTLAKAGANGVDVARGLGGDLVVNARKAGRSTQDLIAERPVEALLTVGAVAFALGWIGRRARELRAARNAEEATPRAARARARARPRTATRTKRSTTAD